MGVEKGAYTYDFHTLGLPFFGPLGGRDEDRMFMSPRTDFGIEKGHMLPTVHFHGRKVTRGAPFDPNPTFLGKSEYMGTEKKGGWFMTRIKRNTKLAKRLFDAGKRNALRASTGLAGNLQRSTRFGEYTLWVPGELSLMEKTKHIGAVNDFAISVPILKALYVDNGLEWLEIAQEKLPSTEPEKRIYRVRKTRYKIQ